MGSFDLGKAAPPLASMPPSRHTHTMPEKRPKRPRDPAQLAKLMIDIASGQVEDRALTPEERGKNPAAAELGRKGGQARAAKMSADKRRSIAKKAAKARWKETSDA